MSQVKPIVVHLDELCQACGYFNSNTDINNGYGCNAPDNQEAELIKINGETERFKNNLHYQIEIAALRKEYGSVAQIKEALANSDGQAFLIDIRRIRVYNRDFVTQFGCKWQGKCFSFSCPIATECDLEDLKEYSQADYEEWESEDNDPSESGANLMLIDDADLQVKLGYEPEEETT